MVAFTKPSLSIDAQLTLLMSRGLQVPDYPRAKRYFTFINYYRLGGYFLPFCLAASHNFKQNTSFDDVLNLYIFDRQLRLLSMDAIERIEIGVRTAIINVMSNNHGAHWYMDSRLFSYHYKFNHNDFLEQVKNESGYHNPRKRGPSLNHYYTKYTYPALPPSWMIGDILSLGTWSIIFERINCAKSKKEVASLFSLRHPQLSSWMHALSFIRNICAHHSKLWDRIFTVKPEIIPPISTLMTPNTTFFAYSVMMNYMLTHITNAPTWSDRLCNLIASCPLDSQIHMGFPVGWHLNPFWRISPTAPVPPAAVRKRSQAQKRICAMITAKKRARRACR
jgi:abortive infection bacteriophage resistance protein